MNNFIIVGNKNAVAYQGVFPLLKDGMLHIGYTSPNFNNLKGLCRWYTTYPTIKKKLIMVPMGEVVKYDNYNAAEISRIKNIPNDYYEPIGVPITIFDYDLSDWEIIGILQGEFTVIDDYVVGHQAKINGKDKYNRIIIKRKQ